VPELYRLATDNNDIMQITHSAPNHASLPSWSFDNTHLAFTLFDIHTGNYEIYTANIDGSQLRNLTHDPSVDYTSVWAPKTVPLTEFTDCNK
jgi:Tol biopolymer transport system component